jgi:hypothetical protein
MRGRILAAAAIVLSGAVVRPAAAQTAADTATTPGAERVAGELLQVMHLDTQWPVLITQQVDAVTTSQPLMAPYRQTMLEFFAKYGGWTAVEPQMRHLYAQTFTEAELRDLIVFYRTPTGQKAIAKLATLQTRGREIGEQVVAAHRDELTTAISARALQLSHDTTGAAQPPASTGARP